MPRFKIRILVYPVIYLALCVLSGLWLQSSLAVKESLPPLMLVNNSAYLGLPGPVAELQAQTDLYAGDYPAVRQALKGRILSVTDITLLVRADLGSGRDVEALTLINRFKSVPEIDDLRGFYLAKQGDFAQAAVLFTQAQAYSSNELWQLGLAEIRLAQGKTGEAEQLLQKVCQVNPDSAAVAVVAGDIAWQQGDYGQAWRHYSISWSKGHLKKDPLFLSQYAVCGLNTGRNITPVLAELSQTASGLGFSRLVMAETALKAGKWQEGQSDFQAAENQTMPPKLRAQVSAWLSEIQGRLAAQSALNSIIDKGGD